MKSTLIILLLCYVTSVNCLSQTLFKGDADQLNLITLPTQTYWYNKSFEETSADKSDAYYYVKYVLTGNRILNTMGTKAKVLKTHSYVKKNNEWLYDGNWSSYSETGQQQLLSATFKEGIPTSTMQSWHPNGKIMKIYPVNGTMKSFDENDNLVKAGSIQNGLGNGLFIAYENGKKKTTYHYLNGALKGLATWFDAEGKVTKERYVTEGEQYIDDYSWYLHEGLQKVIVNKLYGYIDSKGAIVIKPQYKWAADFKEGKAEVESTDGRKLNINKKGIVISYDEVIKENKKGIEMTYDEVIKEFAPGVLLVKSHLKYGLVDKLTNDVLLPVEYYHIDDPVEEMTMVYVEKDNKITKGFINNSFKLVIPAKYTCAKPFSESLASVCIDNKWGYIDKEGYVKIELKYKMALSFVNGVAEVMDLQNNQFKINKKGERL